MKRFRYFDVVFILTFSALLFGFVSLRVFTKEILMDRLGLSVPGSQCILYDLNTTIDPPPEAEGGPESRYMALVRRYRGKLEAYTTSAMAFNRQINTLVEGLNRRLANVPATYSNLRYIAAPAENTADFASYLEERGVPFLYAATPCRDGVLSRQGEKKAYENSLAERGLLSLKLLREEGVPVLDLGEDLAAAGLTDYDTSSHWFPESALYSARVLAEALNTCGFSFRPELFDARDAWDYLERTPELSAAIEARYGYRYSLPIPNAAEGMTFTLTHEGSEFSGTFPEAYLRTPNGAGGEAYHGFSRTVNSTLHRFHNPDCGDNAGKRLLIIGDSFDWLLASYLSVDIEWIDVIHNASFAPSLRQYIQETAPDMVLVVYNDAEFVEIYTEEAFQFD